MITVDSAADETLAGEITRKPLVESLGVALPNLRLILRDKAHGARRTQSLHLLVHMSCYCG